MADVQDAIEFLRQANDAESENRQNGLTALQFRYGDQWPEYAVASRGLERPKLVINETNAYIKKVANMQRQQRPRGKASPVDDKADPKIAKIITGIGRHVENNSDADHAYDTAFDFAATIGWGYWRLRTDYISEDSFNQDIFIDSIDNPFTVYFDYNSKLPDGSDAEKALITDLMSKKAFKLAYPSAQDNGFHDRGTGDSDPDWVTDTDIRIAEYYFIDRTPEKLVMLSDGTVIWASELGRIQRLMKMAGIGIKGERDSFKRVVKWRKQTGYEILKEKEIAGRYIPVVPVYWTNVVIDSRRIRQGLVKDAMDPARMNNFWQSAITESLGQGIKAKYLMPEGGDEGHENEWKNANLANYPTLHYKTTGVDGREIPTPTRIPPEPPPTGMIEAAFMANQNLSRVMGIFDPAVRGGAQHKSDKTLNAEQGQSEMSNFDGYDNLTRSIKHTWRIILGWVPSTLDTQRIQRIIGEDGRDSLVTINEHTKKQDEYGNPIETVLNDVTVGTYDVVMDTGPGYETRRQEGVAATMELMATPIGEKVAMTADDLIVRQMDFPGADEIADRLAAANPLSQIDEKSDIPPQAQMMIKGLQQKLQEATQVIQQLQTEVKYKTNIEAMKQEGATKREHMKATTKAYQIDEENKSIQHSVEVKAMADQNVAEIHALSTLLSKHMDVNQIAALKKELAEMDVEQDIKHAEVTKTQ